MVASEIRWVGIGDEWKQAGYGNPYIGGRPTVSDLLSMANKSLEDGEEFNCSIKDVRMSELERVAHFIDTLRDKRILK